MATNYKVGDIITVRLVICSKTESLEDKNGIAFSYKARKLEGNSYNSLDINESDIESLWLPRQRE